MHLCMQKINFILHIFLETLERYCKLVILGTLGMPDFAHPKWYYELAENVYVYLKANKASSSLMFFPEMLQRYLTFLFWVLWACLATHTKINSINL